MSLVCWWCVHGLPEKPCFHLPIKYDDRRKIFSTIGNFCSWACAKAYAIDMESSRKGEICSILALMRMQSIGKYTPLWPAPKRQCLAIFGGSMTIEQFRSYGGHTEPPRIHYPFEKIYTPVETSSEFTSACAPTCNFNNKTKLKAIESSESENDSLRLKRTKPLVRATSKLESVLGIKRSNC